MGIAELLTVAFTVLKLIGKVDWSWWIVLLPEIIAVGLYLVLVIIHVWQQVTLTKEINSTFRTRKK